MELTEILARMWIECDPNRGGIDPDEIMPEKLYSGGTGTETVEHDNPMGGEPRWKWFVPRAAATIDYLQNRGWIIVQAGALNNVTVSSSGKTITIECGDHDTKDTILGAMMGSQ